MLGAFEAILCMSVSATRWCMAQLGILWENCIIILSEVDEYAQSFAMCAIEQCMPASTSGTVRMSRPLIQDARYWEQVNEANDVLALHHVSPKKFVERVWIRCKSHPVAFPRNIDPSLFVPLRLEYNLNHILSCLSSKADFSEWILQRDLQHHQVYTRSHRVPSLTRTCILEHV